MTTTTVSTNNQSRIGGLAAFGILLMFGYAVWAPLAGMAFLVMAVYYFALARVESSALGLVATACAAGAGILLLFISLEPSHLYNVAVMVGLFLPPLLAGWTANGKAGFPRWLAIIGMAAGAFGLLNFVVVTLGGGNYMAPNNPALTPFIFGTYYPAALATLVWLAWGGLRMFRRA